MFDGSLDISGNQLDVYPNPNTGKFIVFYTGKADEQLRISITNTLGQVKYERIVNGSVGEITEEIDLEELPQGIYMVSVRSRDELTVKQIVITR
jgi:hypothetical protein